MIGFNVPIYVDKSIEYIGKAVKNEKICGDGEFTKKCSKWMQEKFNAKKVLMTTSCTSALEMAAILLDIKPGEKILYICINSRCVCYGRSKNCICRY